MSKVKEKKAPSPEHEEANALYRAGKHKHALQTYTEALQSDPTDERLYSNRAACLIALGKVAPLHPSPCSRPRPTPTRPAPLQTQTLRRDGGIPSGTDRMGRCPGFGSTRSGWALRSGP